MVIKGPLYSCLANKYKKLLGITYKYLLKTSHTYDIYPLVYQQLPRFIRTWFLEVVWSVVPASRAKSS